MIPRYQESSKLQMDFLQKQAKYSGQSDYHIELLGILKNIEDRKDVLKKIDSALPSDFSLASVFSFFQKKSAESQLTVKSITFSKVLSAPSGVRSETSKIKNISFVVNLSGSYQGLKNLLSSLDRSDRLFQVENISFASSEPLSDEIHLQSQLDNYDFKLEVKTQTY